MGGARWLRCTCCDVAMNARKFCELLISLIVLALSYAVVAIEFVARIVRS